MINPFLIGSKIYLSPLSKADISEKYISWLNDKEVCRDNSHATFPNTRSKTVAYIENLEKSKDEAAFAIRWKKNNLHIGNAAIQKIDRINRSAELAIIIGDKKYWGKGIASEVYRLLIEYGFDTLNLNRISSGQTLANKGMIKVCEKSGMKREGVLRQILYKEGKYLDAGIYSILKKEFEMKVKGKK
ncbi:MAG TPA: GNAT family protein [Ignavibacteria bacterium]|nr:N-acetyltransferase [Bacteroidota bacterium]HRI83911.1 GNAT family protein [Ignavibacteria bacterium]HRJ98494.1 GNAT family protein [Ignavibacteria bacterium]